MTVEPQLRRRLAHAQDHQIFSLLVAERRGAGQLGKPDAVDQLHPLHQSRQDLPIGLLDPLAQPGQLVVGNAHPGTSPRFFQ